MNLTVLAFDDELGVNDYERHCEHNKEDHDPVVLHATDSKLAASNDDNGEYER